MRLGRRVAVSLFLASAGLVTAVAVVRVHAAQNAAPAPAIASTEASAAARQLLDTYCVTCHNGKARTAATQTGVVLDAADLTDVGSQPALWEKVVRRLRAGTMPPQGAQRPDDAAYHALTAFLESGLDRAALAHPHPGRPALHRLNRAEYGNAIRDLLALDVDASSLLPPDDSAYGFDNIADALGVSPSLQERYLAAAAAVSALAVGDVHQSPVTDTYTVRQDLSQNQHVEGLPLGTLGGTLIRRIVPVDADYDLKVRFFRTNFGNLRGLEHPHQVEVAVDGRQVRLVTIGGDQDLEAAFEKPTEAADAIDARFDMRLRFAPGPHTITVAFVENAPLLDTVRLEPFLRSSADTLDWTGRPHLDRVTMTGPFTIKPPGDTASRARLFSCRPAGQDERSERACARQILSTLARRAYRLPSADADLPPILTFFERSLGSARTFTIVAADKKIPWTNEHDIAPLRVKVKAGSTVTFTNSTSMTHTLEARDGSWRSSPIQPGGTGSVTVMKPGVYDYVCRDHPWAFAQLIVEEASGR